jgi:Na+/melibiose symporter-like transporter
VPVALIILLAAIRLVPDPAPPRHTDRRFDVAGAISVTTGMLLLVYTLVEAPDAGWSSARTLGSLAAALAILAAFVWHESRTPAPLVRLGIFRNATLVRANLGAMSLIGGWFGVQFIATLYMQSLRGWSALETGLAIFPGGLLVALIAPRLQPLIERFGVSRLIVAGLLSTVAAYALFLPIGLQSHYAPDLLPTFVLGGLGFALAYGPLNIAATTGVEPHEQGLAGGLVNTSFQFGGALVLAIATAVNNANASPGTAQGVLDGFHAAIYVSLAAAVLGVAATALRGRGGRLVLSRA